MKMDEGKVSQGIEFLAEQGLNLFAILSCEPLPDDVTQAMLTENVPLHDYTNLVLLGHGGRRMWQALTAFGLRTADPVDHFSLVMTRRFIDDFLGAPPVLMLYPTGYSIPLQKLGALAGWHHPSPLGLGINETFGLWFAYRAAFLTTLPLPSIQEPNTPSPCDTCPDQPCIKACPAQAVQGVNQFKVSACVDFRLQEKSVCQDRCLSRLACPVAPEHRYGPDQLRYHYTHSLASLRQYYR
jgi:ferredoxin-like protein FixX